MVFIYHIYLYMNAWFIFYNYNNNSNNNIKLNVGKLVNIHVILWEITCQSTWILWENERLEPKVMEVWFGWFFFSNWWIGGFLGSSSSHWFVRGLSCRCRNEGGWDISIKPCLGSIKLEIVRITKNGRSSMHLKCPVLSNCLMDMSY